MIDLVVGARPNFVKAAAILHAAEKYPEIQIRLVCTGQHWGSMSGPYFKDLSLPKPYKIFEMPRGTDLAVGRFGSMIMDLEFWSEGDRPDLVLVVGDTDSTLAGALAAVKSGLPVAHVEAGLRCGDTKMQEEINRILVDRVSTIHYTTTDEARNRLLGEGHRHVRFVGNTVVDTLYRFISQAKKMYPQEGRYAVLTLHRAENVDNVEKLVEILRAVKNVARTIPVIWPIHPRVGTAYGINYGLDTRPPMGYLQFISTLVGASFVMTDSGGVQEETTALGVPCLTLRSSTERPETISQGTNILVGTEYVDIFDTAMMTLAVVDTLVKPVEHYRIPDLWDGHAAERIMEDLCATSL